MLNESAKILYPVGPEVSYSQSGDVGSVARKVEADRSDET